MASVTIKIDMDNAAFEDNGRYGEVTHIIQHALKYTPYGFVGPYTRNLRDANGNTVGNIEVKED